MSEKIIECSLDAQQCQQECKHKNRRIKCPFVIGIKYIENTMSENNLPKEIMDKPKTIDAIYRRHKIALIAPYFDVSIVNEMIGDAIDAAALHYSQILEEKDKEKANWQKVLSAYQEQVLKLESEIEQLKASLEQKDKEIEYEKEKKQRVFDLGKARADYWKTQAETIASEYNQTEYRQALEKAVIAINNMDDLYLHSDLFKQRAKELFSVGDEINKIINPQTKTNLLNSEQNPERSVATEAKSELPDAYKQKKSWATFPEPNPEISKLQSQIKGLVEAIGEIKQDSLYQDLEYKTKLLIANTLTNYYNSITPNIDAK